MYFFLGDTTMRTIFLAIIIAFLSSCVLSPACKAQDSNNPATKAKVPAVTDFNISEGKIPPMTKDNCVREIMGEIFLSRTIRSDINDNVKIAIEKAFTQQENAMVFWVNMTIDTDMLIKLLHQHDPNVNTINKDNFAGLVSPKIRLQPIFSEGKEFTNSQGHFLKQDIIFELPEDPISMHLVNNQVYLAYFTLSRRLVSLAATLAIDQNNIFPRVKSTRGVAGISSITFYAKKIGMQALRTNHLRFFVQPQGIVTEAIDVNLVTGDSIIYPGSNNRGSLREMTISSSDVKEIRNMLTSKEFLSIPQQNNKVGADGFSYFIELDIDGSYLWKSHWETDDKNYINAINLLKTIFQLQVNPSRRQARLE
jgi:hypothetical protein